MQMTEYPTRSQSMCGGNSLSCGCSRACLTGAADAIVKRVDRLAHLRVILEDLGKLLHQVRVRGGCLIHRHAARWLKSPSPRESHEWSSHQLPTH